MEPHNILSNTPALQISASQNPTATAAATNTSSHLTLSTSVIHILTPNMSQNAQSQGPRTILVRPPTATANTTGKVNITVAGAARSNLSNSPARKPIITVVKVNKNNIPVLQDENETEPEVQVMSGGATPFAFATNGHKCIEKQKADVSTEIMNNVVAYSNSDSVTHVLRPVNSTAATTGVTNAVQTKTITINIPTLSAGSNSKVFSTCVLDSSISSYGPIHQPKECQIDVILRNVVCAFNTRCHLNLRQIAQTGHNVIFKSSQNLVEMKLRNPRCTSFIFSSGKITCTGCNSEENAKLAAKKFTLYLKRRGFSAKCSNYRVVNVMATCAMPFTINLADLTRSNPQDASYEPEINPGVTYKFKDIKASLKIFTSGKVTVTAPNAAAAERAVQLIHPIVFPHKREYLNYLHEEYDEEDSESDLSIDDMDGDIV